MTDIVLLGNVSYYNGYMKSAGVYRIATELRKNNYSVQCIDLFSFMPDEDLNKVLAKFITKDTLYVGISSTLLNVIYYPDRYFAVKNTRFLGICNYINSLNQNTRIVVGGSQALTNFNDDHKYFKDHIDFFISGQGEGQALALASHCKHGDQIKYSEINGIKYITDKHYPFNDFNTSIIDYEESDIVFPNETLPLEIARGCAFRCSFCTYNHTGKTFDDMVKSVDAIRMEVTNNFEKFGTINYMIMDDTLNDSMKKIEFLHKIFTSLPFKIKFSSFARLDVLRKYPQMIPMLKEMGMVGVNFGIETLHKKAGQLIGKGMGGEKVKEALKMCKDVWGDDIAINANFIFGLPGEPVESMIKTMEWIESDNCPIDSVNLFPLSMNKNRSVSMLEKGETKGFNYGFSSESCIEWKHENMTYSSAMALKLKYDRYFSMKWPNFGIVKAFVMQRLANIGFSIEDSLHINKQARSNIRTIELLDGRRVNLAQEIMKKTSVRRKQYIEKLLEM